jgi:superfamily I DNA/RNA helicase
MRRNERKGGDDGNEVSFGEIAVLCRLHALFPLVEETLARDGIPFQRFGEHPVRRTHAVGSLISSLRWLLNPHRDEDLLEALSTPSIGMTEKALLHLRSLSLGSPTPLWEQPGGLQDLPGLDPRDRIQLQRQVSLLRGLLQESRAASPGEVVRRLVSILRFPVPDPTAAWDPGVETCYRFLAASQSWRGDLASLVDQWSLLVEDDLYDPRADRVSLLTVHAAKGLEFSVVFLAGCEEGLFPRISARDTDLEEERRLFFVALSRARDLLYLTWARKRVYRGQAREGVVSRFLAEIPPDMTDAGKEEGPSSPRRARQLKLF